MNVFKKRHEFEPDSSVCIKCGQNIMSRYNKNQGKEKTGGGLLIVFLIPVILILFAVFAIGILFQKPEKNLTPEEIEKAKWRGYI